MEHARGIYSFSQLTFHENFTARKLINSSKSNAFSTYLLPHLVEERWQEVFLLSVGMVENADNLLIMMAQQVDRLVADNNEIQQFLIWVDRMRNSISTPYKPAAVRASFLVRDCALIRALARDPTYARNLDFASALDLLDIDFAFNLIKALDLALEQDLTLALTLDSAFNKAFQVLAEQLPAASQRNRKYFSQWWIENGLAWTEQLRSVVIQYPEGERNWQFSPEQNALLQQYYYANQLLVACLNSGDVSPKARQDIESSLLLPVSQNEKAVT